MRSTSARTDTLLTFVSRLRIFSLVTCSSLVGLSAAWGVPLGGRAASSLAVVSLAFLGRVVGESLAAAWLSHRHFSLSRQEIIAHNTIQCWYTVRLCHQIRSECETDYVTSNPGFPLQIRLTVQYFPKLQDALGIDPIFWIKIWWNLVVPFSKHQSAKFNSLPNFSAIW